MTELPQLGDLVRCVARELGLPREAQVPGRIIYVGGVGEGSVPSRRMLKGAWASQRDHFDFDLAPQGRHFPRWVDPSTRRPEIPHFGPLIVRLDIPHKVTLVERAHLPAIPADEIATLLVGHDQIGGLVFDGLRRDLYGHEASDLETRLDEDAQEAELLGRVSAKALLRVIRAFPNLSEDVFWLLEHGNLTVPPTPPGSDLSPSA